MYVILDIQDLTCNACACKSTHIANYDFVCRKKDVCTSQPSPKMHLFLPGILIFCYFTFYLCIQTEEVTLAPLQVQTTSSTANNNLNAQLSSGENKLEHGTDSDEKSFSHDIGIMCNFR